MVQCPVYRFPQHGSCHGIPRRKQHFYAINLLYSGSGWKGHTVQHLLTYLLTPWSRVLLEKLIGSAVSQEIPRIFGTRRFLTVPTSARHLSLSWANSIQSTQLPPTSWRSIFILSSHLRLGLPNGLFPSGHCTIHVQEFIHSIFPFYPNKAILLLRSTD